MIRVVRLLLMLLPPIMVCSCFTGVESTPRITVPQSLRSEAVTAEDTVMAGVARQPFSQWLPGKRFFVTDNRIKVLMGATAPEADLAGRQLVFESAESGLDPAGSPLTRLRFRGEDSNKHPIVTLNGSLAELASRDDGVEIPFAVEMSMVEDARRHLAGRKLYVVSPLWRDTADYILPNGRKFVEVKIRNVMPGSSSSPLRIDFEETATGREASFFITPDSRSRSPRTFAHFFSLTDPRERYRDIPPNHWQMIVRGEIAAGMTPRECRLSLGNPSEINRQPGVSIMRERWIYEDGRWLLFEDNILIDYRK